MIVYAYLAAIVLCLAASAFFSASEMALSSCNRVRLEHAAENGDGAAKRALRITERFDDTLSAILAGNNLVNIASSSLGSLTAIMLLGSGYTWASTAILTALVIVFGETIPKIVAKKHATAYARAVSGPVRFLTLLLAPVTVPVVALVSLLTRSLKGETAEDEDAAVEELHTIIETAENEKVLDEDASELVSAAIDFSDISASEVMTARVDMTAIDIGDDWEDMLEVIESSPYSRIPVYEDSIDNMIGILSMNHVLKAMLDPGRVDIRTLLLPVCYVYKTMKLPAVLSALRESQQHLAVVTDEYGGTLGVVSMEDVLEQLVGEIWDETDTVEEDVREHAEGVYELDGDMPVSDWIELMDWDEDDFDFDSETVGGWCIEMLDGFPEPGAEFTYRDAHITVEETDERRVRTILVRKEGTAEKTD